jgi:hypothetical protein
MAQAARATKPAPAPATRARPLLPPPVPVRRKTPAPLATAEGPAVRIGMPAPPESGPHLKMPPAPTDLSPAARRRLARTRTAAARTATAQSTLPPAQDHVSEAQAHVTPPKEEPIARQEQGVIEGIQKPSPEIEKLCDDIYDIIKGLRPQEEKDLVHADPEAMAQQAGDKMQNNVQGGIDQVHQGYAAIDQRPVETEPGNGKDIPPPPNAAAAPPMQADQATPDPIPPRNVSLDADVKDSQAQIDQAGMNTEPAKLVQEGPVADARAAQGDLQQAAKQDPARILAAQQAALDKAGGDMDALQKAALQSLASSRHATTGGNRKHQEDMAGKEHQDRAAAGAEATRLFNKAKHQIDELINPLTKTAMDMWKAGVDKAKGDFKEELKDVDKSIEKSHKGVGGWFRKKWHKWRGLPDWVTERYDAAEKKFGDAICGLARKISSHVNTVVAGCQGIISDARTDIDDVFTAFARQYPDWVAAEKAKFGKQLDALSQRANGVRDNFNKQLIQNATEAMQDVHDELEERREEAKGILGRIVDAIKDFIKDPIRTIINALLSLLGIPKAAFWAVVEKIKRVISDIADDPLGFAKNLLKAVGQGFSLFFDHILKHMAEGFIDWFTGGLASAGVELPRDFSLGSVITFLLQLMGITWPRIRKLLAKHVGEQNIEMIETVWSMISTLVAMGPEGIFKWIEDKLDPQKILDQIVDMAVDYIMSAVIKGVTARIIMLFNPVGAILQAIEAIYRVLKWIFVNAARIFKLIETVVDGIADILAGNIGGMAAAVERALVSLIAPVIDFLADYFQFGDLPDKVRDTIIRFQTWVEGILDRAIGWLVDKAKGALGIGKKKTEEPKEDGEFIYEKPDGGHTIKIRRDLTVVKFSNPVVIAGTAAQAVEQQALESIVKRTAPTYPLDLLGRAGGPSGHVKDVKDGEDRDDPIGTGKGYLKGDHRGHLIADRFHGSRNNDNFVPMHLTLNLSTFKVYENNLAKKYLAHFKAGEAVLLYMHVKPNYPGDDPNKLANYRPASVSADSKIITLRKNASQLDKDEELHPGNFDNPGVDIPEFDVNTADETTLRALRIHKDVVTELLKEREKRRFSSYHDVAERLLYKFPNKPELLESLTGLRDKMTGIRKEDILHL